MPKCPRCGEEIDYLIVRSARAEATATIVCGELVHNIKPRLYFFCPSEICLKRGRSQLFASQEKAKAFLMDEGDGKTKSRW